MAEWKFPNLKLVSIRRCKIDKIGSLDLPSLEEINLSDNDSTKDFCEIDGWKCPNLKKINLSSCRIKKIGSFDLPSLEVL